MWLELYLTAQEFTNCLGNAGPLTEVAGFRVIISVECISPESLHPPSIQRVFSFSITDAAEDLFSVILMMVLGGPNRIHVSNLSPKYETLPPQITGFSLMSPPIAHPRTDSKSPNSDVHLRLESVRSMTSVFL